MCAFGLGGLSIRRTMYILQDELDNPYVYNKYIFGKNIFIKKHSVNMCNNVLVLRVGLPGDAIIIKQEHKIEVELTCP